MSNDAKLVSVMYHYVRDVAGTPFPGIKGVSVDGFRDQVRLVKETFLTPELEAVVDFVEGRWQPGRDICILTFDDGLREHHDTAAQILGEEGVTGAFFLPTAAIEDHEVLAVHMAHFLLASMETAMLADHVGTAAVELGIPLPESPDEGAVRAVYRWDDAETARLKFLLNHQLHADDSERVLAVVFERLLGPREAFARELYLTWDQASSMQAAGFAIGGHTDRHRVLSSMSPEDQVADLTRSTNLLKEHLGEGARGFAYPYGKPATYTDDTIRALDGLGYSCAFNTVVDRPGPGVSRWEIPRIDTKDL